MCDLILTHQEKSQFFSQSHMLMSSQSLDQTYRKEIKLVSMHTIYIWMTSHTSPSPELCNMVCRFVRNLLQIIYISCQIHIIVMKQMSLDICINYPSIEAASSFLIIKSVIISVTYLHQYYRVYPISIFFTRMQVPWE